MTDHRRRPGQVVVCFAALAALTACGVSTASDSLALDVVGRGLPVQSAQDTGSVRSIVDFHDGLRQVVIVTPREPRRDGTISVRSTLINRGSARLQFESRICGLIFSGTLRLSEPPGVLKCAGFSASGTLAPGDSIVGGDFMQVSSGAGSHVLTVHHAMRPAHSADVVLQVREP